MQVIGDLRRPVKRSFTEAVAGHPEPRGARAPEGRSRRAGSHTCSFEHFTFIGTRVRFSSMSSEKWLEKAERLRTELTHLTQSQLDQFIEPGRDEREALERVTIARWLKNEFSDERPEDTATLALFPEAPHER
jgi:hypothetical protein